MLNFLKKDAQGCFVLLKKFILALGGLLSYSSFYIQNKLFSIGLENIKNLPKTKVLFISNHQTYFSDAQAILHELHRSSIFPKKSHLLNILYLFLNKFENFYFITALETMKNGILPRFFCYSGAVNIKRSTRENGRKIKRTVDTKGILKIHKWKMAGF